MPKNRDDDDRVIIQFDHDEGDEPDEPVIDLFSDDDEPSRFPTESPYAEMDEEEENGEEETEPEQEQEKKPEKEGQDDKIRLSFDRNGRRIPSKKKKKNQYGKRKNAPKATTKVVENDTIARRELEAAKERSRQRAERRQAKEAHEKKIRERERRERRRAWIKTGALTAGVLIILAIMTWYTTRLKTIDIKVMPEGYTTNDIVELSGLRIGRSMLFQNLDEAKANIERDAYLRATLRYSFPSTVIITLDKRIPVACVRWGPQNEYLAIIDSNGVVLNSEAETTGGLIIAEGMNVTTAQSGRTLGDVTDMQVASLIRILSKLEELDLLNRSPRLYRIDMSELMNISISTEGSNYSIEVGDTSNLDTKLMLLQKHWTEVMDRASQYISNGFSTATIYLYSKGGISISPYEPGYYTQMEQVTNYALGSDNPVATPSAETTPDPNAEPTDTPTPAPTPIPHQDGAFTG